MKHLPIRLQLTAWYCISLSLGLLIFGSAAWLALDHRLLAGVDIHLAERLEGLKTALGEESIHSRQRLQRELSEFASQNPDGSVVELRDHQGEVILPASKSVLFARPVSAVSEKVTTIEKGGKPFRLLTTRLEAAGETYDVFLAAPLAEVESVTHDFRNLLFMLVPLVLLVACAGGYWLSLRALKPVDAITTVARSISLQNLSERITVPRTGDELERMAETWNDVLERLDSAVKRVRQFTADASHELRTPLSIIRATAGLALRREREAEVYRQSLREIEHQSEVMTGLTEAMLTIARSDFEGINIAPVPTDLSALVTATVQESQSMASEKGIRLKATGNAGTCVVVADTQGIQKIMRILIDNAVKHTAVGGEVTVAVEPHADGALLSVEDTGEGIAPTDLPLIFQRFYTADPARGGSGFGLGLSIAQSIARAHGSEIVVSSVQGEGARFSMVLHKQVSADFHTAEL